MSDLSESTDEELWNEIEICKGNSKRLAGKKSRQGRIDAAQNADRFTELTRELKRRGQC